MEYEEAERIVRQYVAEMELEQIERGNEQFRYAFISGALQAMVINCLRGFTQNVEHQIKRNLKTPEKDVRN